MEYQQRSLGRWFESIPGDPLFIYHVFGWPSGLRRWFKAPVSSGAWVRIPLRTPFCSYNESAIGLVVKYLVANEVPRVRFPDGAYLAPVAQLVAPRSYVPMVQGSSPCRSILFAFIVRSYHGETTGSHPNSEVKHHWACLVLRWGTTRESQVLYVFLLISNRITFHSPK